MDKESGTGLSQVSPVKTCKPDTWYMLKGGEFVEVDENE